jgi:drug/metabolite transporter (DMT)-like permease
LIGYLAATAAAVGFGAADFVGGAAARRSSPLSVAASVQAIGVVLLLVLAVQFDRAPAGDSVLLGSVAGLSAGVGLVALYQGLATGNMGVVTALTGAVASMVALGIDVVASRGTPSVIQLAGVVSVIVASLITAFSGSAGGTRRAVALSCAAGTGFGIAFVLLDRAADADPLWSLVATRGSATVLLGAGLVLRRERPSLDVRLVPLAAVLDTAANGLFVASVLVTSVGLTTAVASATPPVVTMLLARAFLGERLRRSGLAAVAVACTGIVLIALG